jgi:hypothetical protein
MAAQNGGNTPVLGVPGGFVPLKNGNLASAQSDTSANETQSLAGGCQSIRPRFCFIANSSQLIASPSLPTDSVGQPFIAFVAACNCSGRGRLIAS